MSYMTLSSRAHVEIKICICKSSFREILGSTGASARSYFMQYQFPSIRCACWCRTNEIILINVTNYIYWMIEGNSQRVCTRTYIVHVQFWQHTQPFAYHKCQHKINKQHKYIHVHVHVKIHNICNHIKELWLIMYMFKCACVLQRVVSSVLYYA